MAHAQAVIVVISEETLATEGISVARADDLERAEVGVMIVETEAENPIVIIEVQEMSGLRHFARIVVVTATDGNEATTLEGVGLHHRLLGAALQATVAAKVLGILRQAKI